MLLSNIQSIIKSLRGKTIAIVYIFEKEDAPGFNHFLAWKDNILIGWLNAIYELKCLPYIIDVRTFIQKASNYSLPHIDYVINLNSGCYKLSTMGLVPSVCSFLDIPCIPCNAVSILSCENKKISNYIAQGFGMMIPQFINNGITKGIYRPINLGNSIGLKKGCFDDLKETGIYQEFIPGYDVTIPLAYNYYLNDVDVLPPILYLPDNLDPEWIFDEKTKKLDTGFETIPFLTIESETQKKLVELLKIFDIKTYGRIDARIKFTGERLSKEIVNKPFAMEDLYFIEVNSMPTIEQGDGFDLAFNALLSNSNHSFFRFADEYRSIIQNPTINGFLLLCSMLSIR